MAPMDRPIVTLSVTLVVYFFFAQTQKAMRVKLLLSYYDGYIIEILVTKMQLSFPLWLFALPKDIFNVFQLFVNIIFPLVLHVAVPEIGS